MDYIFFFTIPVGAILAVFVLGYALVASGSEILHVWAIEHVSLFFWIGIVLAVIVALTILSAYIDSSNDVSKPGFWATGFIALILAPPIGIALMDGFLTFIIEYMTSSTPIISLFLAIPCAVIVIIYQLSALIIGGTSLAICVILTNRNYVNVALIIAGICAFLEYRYLVNEAVIPFSSAFN